MAWNLATKFSALRCRQAHTPWPGHTLFNGSTHYHKHNPTSQATCSTIQPKHTQSWFSPYHVHCTLACKPGQDVLVTPQGCSRSKHIETLIKQVRIEHKARNSPDAHTHRVIEMHKRCWNLPTILCIQTHTIQHCLSLSDSLQTHGNFTFWSGYTQTDSQYTRDKRLQHATQIITSVLWLPTLL